ncbi:MAG: DUF1549 domain-containing protein [Planctomycetota bacterium]|nr:MAG: DUF1549 domain-containing protein [Planctomycetota bacterium]
MRRWLVGTAIWASFCLAGSDAGAQQAQNLTQAQVKFFETKIRPVLVEHCYDCHSSEVDEPGGGLLLDSREGLLRGGASGPAIVPGRPKSSLLLVAMQHSDPNLIMPPEDYGEKVSDAVLRDFERWIQMGAPDPRKAASASQRPSQWEDQSNRQWWAWQPPRAPTVPDAGEGWGRTDVDRFVAAELRAKGLVPSPAADRITLVRRLAFDLTGLPPRPEDLQRFALDESPSPIEQYIDMLLDSPQYGEHFGRHWMDVARYAESTGKDVNILYPHAWRYRDYVIDSFNADKRFDRFIREQLAGDLLHATSQRERALNKIATGFLAIGPKSVNERNPRQFAIDVADEQIDAVSQAFLGVTIACARCHDHKFDPITQRDYTAMAGIFLSTRTHFGTSGGNRGVNRTTLVRLPDEFLAPVDESRRATPSDVQLAREEIERLESQLRELAIARRRGEQPQQPNQAQFIAQRLVNIQTRLEQVDEQGNPLPMAMGVSDKDPPAAQRFAGGRRPFQRRQGGGDFAGPMARFGMRFADARADTIIDSPLLVRGELDKPGEVVPRGLPEFLSRGYSARIPADQSGRLQLADWIADSSNPLTARVIVNRVWSWMFGEGLVATEDNFGTSGEEPSHPALLDYLAVQFIEHDWSIKWLVRELALSSTYQQSSDFRPEAFEVDPQNRLLWRANKRALPAEALRDAVLMAAGELDLQRPSGSLIAAHGDGPLGLGRGMREDEIATFDPTYRSVYLPMARNALPDVLELFDFPDNSAVRGDRDMTIVPSQALYWMNSQAVEQRCRVIARNLIESHPEIPRFLTSATSSAGGAVRRPFAGRFSAAAAQRLASEMFEELTLLILSRPPLPGETEATVEYVSDCVRDGKSLERAWQGVVRSLFASADFRFLR